MRPEGGDGMSYDHQDSNAITLEQWHAENPDAAERPTPWWLAGMKAPAGKEEAQPEPPRRRLVRVGSSQSEGAEIRG
jgi:hypothetical protein